MAASGFGAVTRRSMSGVWLIDLGVRCLTLCSAINYGYVNIRSVARECYSEVKDMQASALVL